ncbi:MAG: hypothetical protein A2W31_13465, partial [Planctomycetes bacterium RBG_16_64_10]
GLAIDADATATVTYSLDDDAGGRFAIDSSTGVVTINPALDYETSTSHSVTIRATSTDGSSTTRMFTIAVADRNDNAPVIGAGQSFTIAEDAANGASVGVVTATDVDTVGTIQNWTITGGNTDGIFAINANTGELTIADKTNLDFETTTRYPLTLTVSDGVATAAPQTVVVAITNVNEAPSAMDDTMATSEDTPLAISAASLLANDTDVDLDTLLIANDTQPTHGTVVDHGDGTFTYTPNADFNGTDSFTYTVSDGHGGTDTATVRITVQPVNDDPVANDDRVSTDQGTALVITAASLLANDTDVDVDTLSIADFTQPAHGRLVDHGDGTLTYTPAAGFHGLDSFTYTVADGNGGAETGLVEIQVVPQPLVGAPPAEPADDDPPADNDPPRDDGDPAAGTDQTTQSGDPDHEAESADSAVPVWRRRTDQPGRFGPVIGQVTEPAGAAAGGPGTAEPEPRSVGATSSHSGRPRAASGHGGGADRPLVIDAGLLWEKLDSFRQELATVTGYPTLTNVAATGTIAVLTVGYTLWTVRGGYLLSSLIASLPAWRMIDPLPILATFEEAEKRKKRHDPQDRDTLHAIIDQSEATSPVPAGTLDSRDFLLPR